MSEPLPFSCSICGEPSTAICVWCTKDTCPNHLCDRCHYCSDCCDCKVRLTDAEPPPVLHVGEEAKPFLIQEPEAAPEHRVVAEESAIGELE